MTIPKRWWFPIPALAALLALAPFTVRADDAPTPAPRAAPAVEVVQPAARATAATTVAREVVVPASQQPATRRIDDFAKMLPMIRALKARYGEEQVLFVSDIDNTLLAMDGDLGSDQWFSWQYTFVTSPGANLAPCADASAPMRVRFEAPPLADDPALAPPKGDDASLAVASTLAALLDIQGCLYRRYPMRLTRRDVPRVVERIKRGGVPSIILTSRGPDFWESTSEELARNGLCFACSAIGDECHVPDGTFEWSCDDVKKTFAADELALLGDARIRGKACLYRDGIYMTSGASKGAALRLLLRRLDLDDQFRAIVFVDDMLRHHNSMRDAFATRANVEIHTFWYTAEHARVAGFNACADCRRDTDTAWKDPEFGARGSCSTVAPAAAASPK